jgi:hypothetical protein
VPDSRFFQKKSMKTRFVKAEFAERLPKWLGLEETVFKRQEATHPE